MREAGRSKLVLIALLGAVAAILAVMMVVVERELNWYVQLRCVRVESAHDLVPVYA